jgi:hypothetical protein
MGFSKLFDLVDKFVPSRKAALFDRMKELEFQYHFALIHNKDTEAAELKVKLRDLRKKLGYAEEI